MELYHHGVKGQKWGVRRYQNLDGTLTQKGKDRAAVKSIVKSMSDTDMYNLGYDKKDISYGRNNYEKDEHSSIAKRIIVREGKKSVSFLDLEEWTTASGEKFINTVIGTRSGDKYRGKGYASKAVKEGQKWFNDNKERLGYTDMNWGARTTNKASNRLAEKHGFKKYEIQSEKGWIDYSYK